MELTMKLLITLPTGYLRDTFITQRALDMLRPLGEVMINPLDRQLTSLELHKALQGVTVTGWGTGAFDEELLAGGRFNAVLNGAVDLPTGNLGRIRRPYDPRVRYNYSFDKRLTDWVV